jgi:hypothetical protein
MGRPFGQPISNGQRSPVIAAMQVDGQRSPVIAAMQVAVTLETSKLSVLSGPSGVAAANFSLVLLAPVS